ncbi:MAG: TSUP family transporter [Treponema sp.]|nr:TSUP family transporter [Treponema sp.]
MFTLLPLHFIIVCPAVFVAGFIDAIAGGGGLITLPAYLLIGLPSHTAIGTNKLSSAMGTVVSTAEYALDGFINWKLSLFCILTSLCGSFIGSNLALLVPDRIFSIVMIVLLPVIALYVLKNKEFHVSDNPFSPVKTLIICMVCAFFVGLYDGFYGPGTGTFMLISLTVLARLSLNEAAGTTKVINLTSNITALAVFLFNGKVLWHLGLVAGLFSFAGHFLGAKVFVRNGSKITRPVIITVLAILFAKIIIGQFS